MPKVNILLVTYNHEAFIRQAVNSILMQRFDGEIEIIVADDASSDATVAIIRTYENIDARVTFRYLHSYRNLGITRNYQRGFTACTAEYVAIIEGDDYWTDPNKISTQIRFLDEHRECMLCATNFIVFEEASKQYTPRVQALDGWEYLTSRSLIRDNLIGNFTTCVYRVESLHKLPPALFEIKSYDWAVHISLGQFGLIGFLRKPMSVYRVHPKGSWSLLTYQEKLAEQLQILPHYDRLTGGAFHEEFDELARQLLDAGAVSATKLRTHSLKKRLLVNTASLLRGMCPPIFVIATKLIIPPVIADRLRNIMRR